MTTPPLHPDLADLAVLLGTWSGHGSGEYPTIEPFEYDETVTFGHVGKPFLAYAQRTSRPSDGFPMHAETGYWRRPAPGVLEVVLAHPTGVTEVYTGRWSATDTGVVIEIATTVVGLAPTAKEVTALERSFVVEGDELRYSLRMAAVGVPMTYHLGATLHRV